MRRVSDQIGQSTIEYVGLLLIAGALFTVIGIQTGLGTFIADRITCVILGKCKPGGTDSLLAKNYGVELAAEVRKYAPDIAYQSGMYAVPVDFRACRSHRCADASPIRREAVKTRGGLSPTVFTRVRDERARGGKLHVQYWFYYPDHHRNALARNYSAFLRKNAWAQDTAVTVLTKGKGSRVKRVILPESGPARKEWRTRRIKPDAADPLAKWLADFHNDDWQSYEVAIDRNGNIDQRTSDRSPILKTNRYSHCLTSECRLHRKANNWWVKVAKGTHEMSIAQTAPRGGRKTTDGQIKLVPLESLSRLEKSVNFAQKPPWSRPVYNDPNDDGDHYLGPGKERDLFDRIKDKIFNRPSEAEQLEAAGRYADRLKKQADRGEISQDEAACKVLIGEPFC